MTLTAIFANVSCSDLERSVPWYAHVFAREPDARPMAGLAEWHHGDASGFQLHQDADKAGRCTLTLIVAGLEAERDRLADAGLTVGSVERADYVDIVRMEDPDGNLVVLAEARSD